MNGLEDQLTLSWMANADGPSPAGGAMSAKIQVDACVDGEIAKWAQLARGEVDGEPFRHGAEVQHKRLIHRDRPGVRIQMDVAVRCTGFRRDA